MTMIRGSVSVDDDGVATGSGFALVLYNELLTYTDLPDPNNPPSAVLTSSVSVSDLNFDVDQTLGFEVGDTIQITTTYAAVVFALGTNDITVDTPSPVNIPSATVIGFPGSASEWEDSTKKIIVGIKKGLAKQANANSVIIDYIQSNGVASVTAGTNAFGASIPPAPVVLTGGVT